MYLVILVFVSFIVMGKPLPCCDGLVGFVLGVEWSDALTLSLSQSVLYKVQVNMTKTVVIFLIQILFVTTQNQDNPCDENPCGKYALCQQFSSGSFLCKCDRNGKYPVGREYQ